MPGSPGKIAKLLLMALIGLAARGQTPKATFEVASVKPPTRLGPLGMASNRKGGPGTTDPGMYTCQNCPFFWVLSEAYHLQPYEYEGPDWVHELRFDFSAKIPPGTTKEMFQEMLQNLLADRFKMVVHRDKKEMQVYELTVARNGPKFKEGVPKDQSQPEGPPAKMQKDSEGFPILAPGTTMAAIPGHARIRSDNRPIAWLVEMLSGQLGSPVIDATGLKAKYDFTVSWAYQDSGQSSAAAAATMPVAAELEAYRPALITAIQAQLGLKLEQKKGLAEVLVLDHAEKVPTEN